ncbi:hypothetical protein IP88_10560 [alpha proteobacterium AAP81b]|nr:hypothetical protein IP88_10560 [alpha proteobacterium AAP81b]
MPPADLEALVTGFAGAPAVVDPRLILPACPAPTLAWATPGSVEVRCAAPAWRIFVPAGSARSPTPAPAPVTATPDRPAIRRGDRVVVEAGGAGFVVAMEATAAGDARDGRVALRTASGRALTGHIGGDGRVRLRD